MNSTHIRINERVIGNGHPTYIVAELSGNHNQEFGQAVELVRAAKRSGADAVKLQTYTPDTITIDSDKKYFKIAGGTPWDDRTLYDLYLEAYTPWDWQPNLKSLADDLEIDFFSSPFDYSAVEFLEKIEVPCYKVASFENIDLPLIEKMANTGKPIIMSTGMANLGEIEEALQTAYLAGTSQVALLKCTSAYPAPPEEMNLRTIPHLAEAFHIPVGLSDHTLGIAVPVAAVSLGACIVEKHLTLSREIPGPDSLFSLEPREFENMVKAIRTAEKAVGKVCYGMTKREAKNRVFRRSLFAVKDIKLGDMFTEENVRSIRPGHGLAPKLLKDVLGHCASCDIERGTPIDWKLVARSALAPA